MKSLIILLVALIISSTGILLYSIIRGQRMCCFYNYEDDLNEQEQCINEWAKRHPNYMN